MITKQCLVLKLRVRSGPLISLSTTSAQGAPLQPTITSRGTTSAATRATTLTAVRTTTSATTINLTALKPARTFNLPINSVGMAMKATTATPIKTAQTTASGVSGPTTTVARANPATEATNMAEETAEVHTTDDAEETAEVHTLKDAEETAEVLINSHHYCSNC